MLDNLEAWACTPYSGLAHMSQFFEFYGTLRQRYSRKLAEMKAYVLSAELLMDLVNSLTN